MLKREPSKLVIEGNQFYIPWVYCVIQDNCIVVDSKSRKLQFKIVCPTYKTLVEDDYLDIYLNKYPDFIHKEQSYYYREFNFQESEFNIEGETFTVLNGNIRISYLSIRTFSIAMELELRASNDLRTMATLYLYPLIKESVTSERNMYFSNLIPKIVKEAGSPVGSINGKPIEELSLEDFSFSSIWEWDLENESFEYQDESWIRPSTVKSIFELDNTDVFIKADLLLEDDDSLYKCILNIDVDQIAQTFSVIEGAAFINEEYIDLRDFLFNPKVNIQKIVFYIQDQTFEKMSPINYRKQQWDLTFSWSK
ncbi:MULTISPECIES: hypothetical protein [Bacillus]|uniref:hypothetical protein n=1 Tax=Bacillus TaxID=1386 RepID=UPI0015831F41|nr:MULTISPECIES: hypothetical protein [Bacillus cereus group]MCQ6521532.1 hypothetical protein [Bacillus paranthracis]MCU5227777.1 hypothetical protein [Bacillus paranthracis]MDA2597463.1 hypothetical protein [Bacillus cereus group sp. Bc061]MDK7490540.1 hypothetical protein [Bacillus paranthracis]MEC4603054.1 hypothetical protein [Bacillus paranthracis]